jgi:hypothetical protein
VNGVAVGIAFQWQNITPFGIPSAGDFLLDPPPALASNQYAKAYNEVMTVGKYRPAGCTDLHVRDSERMTGNTNVGLKSPGVSANQKLSEPSLVRELSQVVKNLSTNSHATY